MNEGAGGADVPQALFYMKIGAQFERRLSNFHRRHKQARHRCVTMPAARYET